jgi:pimeloyl-ACP methyl ester carboxylesterase
MTYRACMPRRSAARLRVTSLTVASLTVVGIASLTVLGVASLPARADDTGIGQQPVQVSLDRYYQQALDWKDCRDLQCARLTVPLDYANPDAGDITLALSRARHRGGPFQGSIVINPGGPGGSGTGFAGYAATALMPAVAARYDIVGFDPRGVGGSAPVTCMTGRQTTSWLLTDTSPDTPAEENLVMRRASTIAPGCLEMSGNLARHVSTDATIRDMDILRAALGSERLDYLGFSYGTYLGAKYAEAFPDRVGRFVLDGAVDPALDSMEVSRGQSTGFQVAFRRFAADCATRPDCPGGRSTRAVTSWVNRLLAQLDAKPLPTGRRMSLNQAQALSAIFSSLYSPDSWPSLRDALKEAGQGRGDGLQFLADYASDRLGPDRYGSNQNSAFYAISCLDFPAPPGREGLRAAADRWSARAPVPELAKSMSWGNAPCTSWFQHSPRPPAPVVTTTTSPILVVGTKYDPATPLAWSQSLHRQLPTSSLLTYDGDGHTAYGAGSACVDSIIDAHFLTGAMPVTGKICR